jgi:hypothetical protein
MLAPKGGNGGTTCNPAIWQYTPIINLHFKDGNYSKPYPNIVLGGCGCSPFVNYNE